MFVEVGRRKVQPHIQSYGKSKKGKAVIDRLTPGAAENIQQGRRRRGSK